MVGCQSDAYCESGLKIPAIIAEKDNIMEKKNDMFNKMPKIGNKPKMFKFNLYWMYGLILVMLLAVYLTNDSSASKELGWNEIGKLMPE